MRDKTVVIPGVVVMRLMVLAAKRFNKVDDETLDTLVQALIREDFDRVYPKEAS